MGPQRAFQKDALGGPRLSRTGSSWYPRAVARASGDATFAGQVLEHIHALHGFAFRLSLNGAEAEDLVQDTFTRALTAAHQFRSGSNLRSWLFRILRNAHIDAKRRERRSPLSPEGNGPELSSDDVAAELLRGDVEIDCLRRRVAEEIETALFALSEDARSVILLDLEGFSEQEVAEVMGCAQGTVKSRLARARAALRLRLAEYAR
jgi:RNA polymerase sigma-70 factor (ECF subfamily)